jgi:hypothetical protein
MFTEARIAAALDAMLRGIEAPPIPLAQIRRRMGRPQRAPRRGWRLYLPAAAGAATILVLALPSVAPGFTQTIEAEIEAVLHWTPPPAPPASVESAMRSQFGNVAAAQTRVDFKIVPPAGLPEDVVSGEIATTPTGVYSKSTHTWSVGSPNVWFVYRRADGRSFMLLADRVDPRQGPPPRYIFEDLGARNGHEVLVRHQNFAWSNGDQVMSAVAGEGITASEIAKVRSAMHGTPFRGVWPPQPATIEKQYRLP